MGWKDTVIGQKEAQDYIDQHYGELITQTMPQEYYPDRWHREIQAEVSFKMGYNQALEDVKAGHSPSLMV